MVMIPKQDSLFQKIESVDITSLPRPYLGLSGIGEKCIRKLQLDHRRAYAKVVGARLNRLFNVGHDMEHKFTSDLLKAGVTVHSDQLEIKGTAGIWAGHIDGIASNHPDFDCDILAEFKTHNLKSFTDLVKNGVKKSKPMHYDQVTSYMGYLDLPACLYMAYNKNDSAYHIEIIKFDPNHFADLVSKEEHVIMLDRLSPRIGNGSRAWFDCKFCDAKKTCHGDIPITKNCRSCLHSECHNENKWTCNHTDNFPGPGFEKGISAQETACDNYHLDKEFFEL